MTNTQKIAIIGASIAGMAAADAARNAGFTGDVHVYDSQPHVPYDKPPLSKGILTGELDIDSIALKSDHDLESANIELRLGSPVREISTQNEVITSKNATPYDGIILANGSRARKAPFPIHNSVRSHVLRTKDDALDLKRALKNSKHAVIIGGGFIGTEVAAAASVLGIKCTVVEVEDHPLARAVGEEVSQFVLAKHRAAGIQFRTGVTVSHIDATPDAAAAVHLSSGEVLNADTIILSIGVEPATDFLQNSRLEIDSGIITDGYCRTNLDNVYACGDAARTYSYLYQTHLRIEHWTTAREQGAHAGANLVAELAGNELEPFTHVPYVWSDQFDMKIQIIGRLLPGSIAHVKHEDDRSLTVEFMAGNTLCGGVAINRVRDAMMMRRTMHNEVTALAAQPQHAFQSN